MSVRKLTACAIVPLALLGAAPSPAPGVVGNPTGDRVYALAGTWSCRSAEGALVRSTSVRKGDTLEVHDVVEQDGKRSSFDDRYTFDPVKQSWHVDSGLAGFKADAAPWTADRWTVEGVDVNTVARRMTLDLLPNGDFRRTSYYENGQKVFVLDTVERCSPGTTPPPANACIADRYPATTLEPGTVNGRLVPQRPALVQVVVSLNERSEIVGTRIQTSPSPEYNAAALAAARASKFRTEIRNCKPIAADYVFSVSFGE